MDRLKPKRYKIIKPVTNNRKKYSEELLQRYACEVINNPSMCSPYRPKNLACWKAQRAAVGIKVMRVLNMPEEEAEDIRRALNYWMKRQVMPLVKTYIQYTDMVDRVLAALPTWMAEYDKKLKGVYRIHQWIFPKKGNMFLEELTRAEMTGQLRLLADKYHVEYRQMKTVWVRTTAFLTYKLVQFNIIGEDRSQEPYDRMETLLTGSEWAACDQLLLRSDTAGMLVLYSDSFMGRPARELIRLAQQFRLAEQNCPKQELAKRWVSAHKHYCNLGLYSSLVALQRRWYQLRQDARRAFSARRRDPAAGVHALHWLLAYRYPWLITEPQPRWQMLVRAGDVFQFSESAMSEMELVEPLPLDNSVPLQQCKNYMKIDEGSSDSEDEVPSDEQTCDLDLKINTLVTDYDDCTQEEGIKVEDNETHTSTIDNNTDIEVTDENITATAPKDTQIAANTTGQSNLDFNNTATVLTIDNTSVTLINEGTVTIKNEVPPTLYGNKDDYQLSYVQASTRSEQELERIKNAGNNRLHLEVIPLLGNTNSYTQSNENENLEEVLQETDPSNVQATILFDSDLDDNKHILDKHKEGDANVNEREAVIKKRKYLDNATECEPSPKRNKNGFRITFEEDPLLGSDTDGGDDLAKDVKIENFIDEKLLMLACVPITRLDSLPVWSKMSENGVIRYADICGKCKNCSIPTCAGVCEGRPSDLNVHATDTNKKTDKHPDNLINLNTSNAIPGVYPNNLIDRSNDQWPVIGDCQINVQREMRTMTDDNAVDFHIDDNASSDFKVDVTHDEMGGDVVGISGDAETVHAENSRDAAHLFLKCKPIELLMDKGMQENVFNTNNSVVVNINNACNAKDVASRTEVESVTQERSAVGLDKASNTISSVCSYKFTIKCNRCKMPIIKGACSCKSCPKIRNFNRNVTSDTSNVANSNKKPAIVKCKRCQKSTGNGASFCASCTKITNVANSVDPNVASDTSNVANSNKKTATVKCKRCQESTGNSASFCASRIKISNVTSVASSVVPNVASNTPNVANSNKKTATAKCKRCQESTGTGASFCASRIKITNVTSVATSAFPNVPPATANAADNSNATVACNNCQKPNKYGALICQKADAHASRGHCTSCHKPIVDGVCGCRVRVSPGLVKCRQCQLNFVNGKCGCRQVNAYTKRRQRRNMELVISEVDKRSTSGGDAGGDDVDESHVPSDGSMSYSDNQETDEEMAFGVRNRGERFVKSIPGHSKRRVTLPNKEQIQRDTKLMPVAQVAPITKNTGDTVPDYEELQALITIEQISEATGRRERRRRDYCCLSRWSRAKNDAHRRQAKRADKRYIDLDWHKRLHKFACDCCCPYLMRGVPPKNTIRREEVWKMFRNIVGCKDDSESQSDENDSGKTKKRKRKCDKDNDGETKKYPTNHSLDSTDPMKDHEEWLRQKSDFKRFFTLGQIAGKNTEESNESTANVSTMKVHTDMLKTKAKAVRKDLAEGKPVIDRKRAENATAETISDDREQKQEAGEEIQTKSIRQRTRKIVRNKLVTQQRGNAEQIEDDLKEWIRQKNSVLPILKKSSNEKSIYNNNDDQLVMDTEIVKECLNNEDSNPNENNGVIEQASTNKSESQSLKWKSDGDSEWTMLEKDPKKIFNFNTNTILDMLYSKEACTSTEINNTVKKPAKTSTDDTIIIESSDEESDSDKNKHTSASVDKTQFSDDGTTEEAVRNADEEKGDDENNEMDVSDAVELSSDNEAQEQTQDADNKKAVIDNLANTQANTVQEIADENVTAKCGLDNNTETIPANRTGVGKSVFTLPSNIARNMIIHPFPGMQPGVQMMAPPKLNTLQTYMTRPILVIPAKLVDGNTTRPILLNMVPTETEPAPSQPNVVAPLTAVNVAQHDKIQDSIPTDLYTSNLLADASGTTRDLTFPTSK